MKSLGLVLIFCLLGAGCAQSAGLIGDGDAGPTNVGGTTAWGWSAGGSGGSGGSGASVATGGSDAFGGSGGTQQGSCVVPTGDSECRTAPLCGCGASQNCIVADVATGRTSCVDAGTSAQDELCTGVGSCATGTTCIDGLCKEYCASDADCGGTRKCIGTVYNGSPVPGLDTCSSGCTLDEPSSCGSGAGCFLLDGGMTDCRPTGTSTTKCSGAQDCAPGYMCMTDGSCAAWCRSGGTPCAVGSCQTGTGAVIVDGVVYGACL